MEYIFTFIKNKHEKISVCKGHNFMDALWHFYDLEGMVNIIKVERIS